MTALGPDRAPTPEPASTSSQALGLGSTLTTMRDICPFLLAGDGAWRSADATSEHRCTAVFPPAQLATEKQRRLCLTPGHESCATFVAALAAREPDGAIATQRLDARPMPRTTPVILERGRFAIPSPSVRPDRTAGQAVLVLLLGVAFAAVLFARLGSGPDGTPGAIVGPSSSHAVSTPAATPRASEAAVLPSASPVAASPTPKPTLPPTKGSPAPSSAPSTYTVRPGDTLSGIAATYGTTWKVLAGLNNIKNPSALKVGTVLRLP